jgi:fumarate hydratase class I
MRNLRAQLLELIRRTSAELPEDVFRAVDVGTKAEQTGTTGAYAMDIITKNIDLAKRKSQPLCQDTGSILFFVKVPVGFDQRVFETAAKAAVADATAKGYLRQNSVDSITGKNSGNNLGPGSPTLHFHQHRGARLEVRLILKGGGCENVGAQYSLPDTRLDANRDLDGVRKAILDAVVQAQGKGCSPGILGVCIGGDRATGYLHSKEQLLRTLEDVNTDPTLSALERDIVQTANKLGIGPMGFGGKTTLLGCKIGALNRLPASFFVSISYMCWAYRRQGFLLNDRGKIVKWLY